MSTSRNQNPNDQKDNQRERDNQKPQVEQRQPYTKPASNEQAARDHRVDSSGQHRDHEPLQGTTPESAQPSAKQAAAHFGLHGSYADDDRAGLAQALMAKENISQDDARKKVDAFFDRSSI